jgi:WD40 repeat protein
MFLGHAARVSHLTFSGDGCRLASVGRDCCLRVWDIASAACVTALRVTEPLASCSWHPSGNAICAAGGGGLYVLDYRA